MAQMTLAPEVRGVLIPLTDASALLPNACVSEVITYGAPQTIEGAPAWVLGIVTWRGWRMPLFSFSKLCGLSEEEETSGAKVAILKAFGGIHKMPYMALLAQGFPKLANVTADKLLMQGDQDSLPDGVLYRVSVEDEEALIPDLNSIERELLKLIEPGSARQRDENVDDDEDYRGTGRKVPVEEEAAPEDVADEVTDEATDDGDWGLESESDDEQPADDGLEADDRSEAEIDAWPDEVGSEPESADDATDGGSDEIEELELSASEFDETDTGDEGEADSSEHDPEAEDDSDKS